jgi:hypothetical protein
MQPPPRQLEAVTDQDDGPAPGQVAHGLHQGGFGSGLRGTGFSDKTPDAPCAFAVIGDFSARRNSRASSGVTMSTGNHRRHN